MDNKTRKKVGKALSGMVAKYGFVSFEFVDGAKHDGLMFTAADGSSVLVKGLPNTSGTELKHVAQNAAKAARLAAKQGLDSCAYGGGKA